MEEFLNKLYSYEYFGTYLMISIIVLLLLFIIILFFGKKDQKNREIEATKKLQQINSEDAFKEESIPQNLEVNTIQNMPDLENDTIVVPKIEDIPTINNDITNAISEPMISVEENVNNNINVYDNNPVMNEIKSNEVEPAPTEAVTIENPMPEVDNTIISVPPIDFSNNFENVVQMEQQETIVPPVIENKPILEKVEEKPLIFNNINEPIKFETVNMEPEIKPEPEAIPQIEVPTFNFDEIVKDVEEIKNEQTFKGPEIFSSVYAPLKEEVNEDIPEEREEVKVPSSDEMELELPTLKKEATLEKESEQIDIPVLNDYKLDDLSGETYIINK